MNSNKDLSTDVLIIGGGISGLATAWQLKNQGHRVIVLEKNSMAGGKIQTQLQQGYRCESAATMVMNFHPQVDAFIKAIELSQQKQARNNQASQQKYMVENGALRAIPMSIPSLMLNNYWSVAAKFKLATEIFSAKASQRPESVANFIRRRMGSEMLTKLIDPFIAGTMASDPELAEAQAVLPRLTALEKKYGSITAGIVINKIKRRKGGANPDVFSFNNGMGSLVEQLSRLLADQIHYDTQAIAIEPHTSGWQVVAKQQNMAGSCDEIQISAKQVVMAQPAKAASSIIATQSATLSSLLASIDYAPLTVVHQGFDPSQIKQALNGSGFLLPKNEQQALLGNLWMSSLFTHRAPTGKVLLTSYLGGCRQPEVRNWSDEQCLEQTYIALVQYLSLKGDPEMIQLYRHSNALPLYHGAYLKKCTEIKQTLAQLPGVHIVANYLDGISVRDRIMQALQVSDKINQNLTSVNTSIISVNNTSTVVQRLA